MNPATFLSDRLRSLTGDGSDAEAFFTLKDIFDDVTVVLVGARVRF